jgi:hypothetical protein
VLPTSGTLSVPTGAPLGWLVNAYLKDGAGTTVAQSFIIVTSASCQL